MFDDASSSQIICRGPTQRRIAFEFTWLSDITLSSATDTIYIIIRSVKGKEH